MEELKNQVSKIYDIVNIVLENQGEMRKDISMLKEKTKSIETEMSKGFKQANERMDKIESRVENGFKQAKERMDKIEDKIDKGFMDTSFEFRRINYIFTKMPNNKEIRKLNKDFLAHQS